MSAHITNNTSRWYLSRWFVFTSRHCMYGSLLKCESSCPRHPVYHLYCLTRHTLHLFLCSLLSHIRRWRTHFLFITSDTLEHVAAWNNQTCEYIKYMIWKCKHSIGSAIGRLCKWQAQNISIYVLGYLGSVAIISECNTDCSILSLISSHDKTKKRVKHR